MIQRTTDVQTHFLCCLALENMHNHKMPSSSNPTHNFVETILSPSLQVVSLLHPDRNTTNLLQEHQQHHLVNQQRLHGLVVLHASSCSSPFGLLACFSSCRSNQTIQRICLPASWRFPRFWLASLWSSLPLISPCWPTNLIAGTACHWLN